MKIIPFFFLLYMAVVLPLSASSVRGDETNAVAKGLYDIVWDTQSHNSSESMPCGGGDIGLNVWVENGELLVYLSRSGTFDENNTMLKLGRLRVGFDTPLDSACFRQRLDLEKGRVEVTAGKGRDRVDLLLWTEIYRPVVHVEISSARPRKALAAYESWRYQDRALQKNESFQNSYKWAPPKGLTMRADDIRVVSCGPVSEASGQFRGSQGIFFCHENPEKTLFDVCLEQQRMECDPAVLFNPLKGRISGGMVQGDGFLFKDTVDGVYLQTAFRAWRLESARPVKEQELTVTLFTSDDIGKEKYGLTPETATPEAICRAIAREGEGFSTAQFREEAAAWWKAFWNRSYIEINSGLQSDLDSAWRAGRNYQLFRYQLGCNAYGVWPTKFNGSLFTFDPVFVNPSRAFTPDFRNWGGGTFTAQNQRLVYFGMLKSGDVEMMRPQFEFYRRMLPNAEHRSRVYWQHGGACFTEQTENFGLPNPSEYGWKRPEDSDPGMEYNKWLEYQWDTALEFCFMILEANRYEGISIEAYLPLIESTLTFFDEHYRYLSRRRGESELDSSGCLRLYPGSACETYKITDNASSTVAALRVLTRSLLDYLEAAVRTDIPSELKSQYAAARERWTSFYRTIPPIPRRREQQWEMIAPARSWERVNNTEAPQLYPVWPWGVFSLTGPDLEVARNTYFHDADVQKFYAHEGWKQYNIFAARLGLVGEARKLTLAKLADAPVRFPSFWGPGFDWTPDHNWGGSAMIGLQEMLMQCVDDEILLFPAWPSDWDVRFKLHAPGSTVVEATLSGGKLTALKVTPESRRGDVKVFGSDIRQ